MVTFIIYILLTAFIFFQSLLDAGDSSKQSNFVSNAISKTVEFFTFNNVSPGDDGKDKTLIPETIEVSGLDSKLVVGKPYVITYKLLPEREYALSKVEFSSSNEEVVRVDDKGNVSAVKQGKAKITIKDTFSNIYKTVDVEVSDTEYCPNLEFTRLVGFSSEDENVYYSPTNSTGAVFRLDFEIDDDFKGLTLLESDEYDGLILTDKIFFTPKKVGEITINAKATYQTVDGEKEKIFSYPLIVKEKLLPTYQKHLDVDTSDISINTNQAKEILVNLNDYSTGVESAQARVFYVYDKRFVLAEPCVQGLKITPNDVGESKVCIYYLFGNKFYSKEISVSIMQGVPKNAKITTENEWAVNGKNLKVTVTGDGKSFDFNDFTWEVENGAFINKGKFYSEKNGVYTVKATHKTIEGFIVIKTLEVKYAFSHYVRKIVGHFSLFLLLAIFASVVYYRLADKFFNNKTALLGSAFSITAGTLTACISEFLQSGLFVSGRAPTFIDVLIDVSGFALGVVFFTCARIIYRKIKNKKLNQT